MSWKHPKVWIPALAALFFLTVILQNTHVVTLRVLFWDVEMSQVILIPLVLTIGLVIGFLVAKLGGKRRARAFVPPPPSTVPPPPATTMPPPNP